MPCDKCLNILHTAWTTIEFSHLWVIKGSSPQSQHVLFKWLYTGGCGVGSTPRNSWQTGYAKLWINWSCVRMLLIIFSNSCSNLYRCTMHSEVYLIYTHQLMRLYIILKKFKIYIKTLLHISIIRSSSGSTYCSLLNLYIKTISDVLRYLKFGDLAACCVPVCVWYTVHSVWRTYRHTTCCHITKFK